MSRIFDGLSPKDIEDLHAILNIDPDIELECDTSDNWHAWGMNWFECDGKRHFYYMAWNCRFRIKESIDEQNIQR